MASAAQVQPVIHDPETVHNNEAALNEKKDSSEPGNEMRENPAGAATNDDDRAHFEKFGTYDRYEMVEEDCYDELGFSFPEWKKWMILSVVFLVQVSMNFNTSLYSNAVHGISEEFGVSAQAARVGAAAFLVAYAFGCELWAPWSEELGRWPVLQLSLFLVNIFQIPVAIAPNYATIIAFRTLGGLSTAGGSVTLAMVADMWVCSAKFPDLDVAANRSIGTGQPAVCCCFHRLLLRRRIGARPHCRRFRRTIPGMAMEHLDSTDLWWRCSDRTRLHGPGDSYNSPHEPHCKEATR